jgi:hypothetical protein
VKRLAAVLLVFLAIPAAQAGPRDDLPPYARCHYDQEVLQYCGVWSDALAVGAELVCAQAKQDQGLDDTAAFRARVDASVAFDREWQNRSNSGKRQWCLGEGRVAALAFYDRALRDRFKEPAGLAKETDQAQEKPKE